MDKINFFEKSYKDPSYDRRSNPLRLPIKDLLPIGFDWKAGNHNFHKDFPTGVLAVMLNDMTGIALVENADIARDSRACVINSDNTVRFEVKPPSDTRNGIFSEVYYVNDKLCFFLYADGEDLRLEVNPDNGAIESISRSR